MSTQQAALLRRLCSSKLFASHPLPESDPFSPLLSRYLPHQPRQPRKDGQTGSEIDKSSLIAGHQWRALANQIADDLVAYEPQQDNLENDLRSVLSLWCTRLTCLRRLHLHSILVSEANGLFTQLPPSYNITEAQQQPSNIFFQPFIPFELVLLRVTLPVYLRGDLYLVLQQLQETAYGCRLEYQRTANSAWIAHLQATAVSMVNVLYRLQELEQAMALLRQIADSNGNPRTLADLCLLALDIGDIAAANSVLDKLRDVPDSDAILSTIEVARLLCDGQAKEAEVLARSIREQNSDDLISKANLAACCMYNGKVQEGIEILEALARAAPIRFYNDEVNISNLISLQELQAGDQVANKLDLLKECNRYASEALSIDCLRLH